MNSITVKYRTKTHKLLAYEAMFRRILKEYWLNDSIVSAYKREKAGYDGERNVDYKLSTYPHKNLFIFQGLRLANPPFHFQIDTLLLTKKFICILEIKNKKGTFKYDSKQQQLTQEINGETKSFKDPILQAEAQKAHLVSWMENKAKYNIPIETLVVVAFPSTIIENVREDPDVYKKIIHNESLHQHLDRLNNNFTEEQFTKADLRNLCKTLLHEDTALRTDLLQKHHLTERHLIKGIPCERCQHYPMKRLYKKWQCPNCYSTSFKAHQRVILDYFLLHGPTITNKECREILQIDSPRTAHTLLNSMHLQHDGRNKGRKYYAPYMSDFPQNSSFPHINSSIFEGPLFF
ncbi:Nuclease-related domain-containing protein [Lentibacillus persicus]|uniref:Nuclease-related domain-containing protein n=1 Tax=Lentibacillus persicus TaxID=640948 RepID=A0A1I1S2T7_9BACI|nr:nuclease-related domain-containing protein [Lentibacillus persicus]SFD37250.1 Nuclease-related domain-containing protein [Lentibacillus persicus]